jgi:hypothetical protein
MEIDMIIVTLTNGQTEWLESNITREEVMGLLEDGNYNHAPIDKVIEIDLALGTSKDITAEIAKAVWDELNANDRAPHHELEQWLLTFGHDCTDFGVVPEPRSMFVPPYRG